ncbi:ABC transporter permease [Ornithinibacillus sp. 179-J 7C1 HS]|uniref:ABC transporter permease n=1 Tax=Ornithinibacillus sp. 179-J 7C1 HS TaxID=3142384 RepID=UPI0039A1E29E
MQFLKFVSLFTKNNFLQLRRKWRSLPLLFVFPILLIGLVAYILVTFISNLEEEPLQIGLVDLDQSSETDMIIQLLEDSTQLGDFLHMERVSETVAKEMIEEDEIVSYILFPEEFTSKLLNGDSVVVTIVGNPNREMESYLIKELVNSAARHISSSQANILTINHFARELNLSAESRNQIVLEQFNEFLLYAISKDNVLDQHALSNNATSSPKQYFGLAAAFFLYTIWIFTIYQLLYKEQSKEIKTRMMLYGVTDLQQITARILITLIISILIGMLLFTGIVQALDINLQGDNYARLLILLALHSVIFLFILSVIETVISSKKLSLLVQLILTGTLMLASGSFIPEIYLPLYLQDYLAYVFSFQVFHWLEEILLNGRVYVDYIPLLLSTGIGLFLTVSLALLKERLKT